MRIICKPGKGEYPEYAKMYKKLLPADGLVLNHLEDNFQTVKGFFYSLPPEKLLYRYAKDKWTIKEILVHIVDEERIYAYRVMSFARNEKQPLPGFDQDDYAPWSGPTKEIWGTYSRSTRPSAARR
jgi:DinB superfamily